MFLEANHHAKTSSPLLKRRLPGKALEAEAPGGGKGHMKNTQALF